MLSKHPLSFLAGFACGAAAMLYLVWAQQPAVAGARKRMLEARRPPETDHQVKDRIRSRLGNAISNPGAVQVEVQEGRVMLRGHVLKNEVDALLAEVQRVAGDRLVHADLQAHDAAAAVGASHEKAMWH